MQFTRLRLSGFKSFVDPTELVIQPGLTGIVGPNGCGKSNLLEALRWVMGETSARLIRGAEMDDVIFAGTSLRPPRNLAEVNLILDNAARQAPAAFNDSAELEISRRIGRDAGSAYRINGKDVRARDVQTLFADAAVGARSPALVGQGRIGGIINARATDRRHILEEAAGIGGLHSRRQEAESRLKAAESNLTRVDDVIGALSSQLNGLKRQSRQATRYRNVQVEIRKGEALLLHLKWLDAEEALGKARDDLATAQASVAEATVVAAAAAIRENEAADVPPPLRERESKAAQTLHRLIVERDNLALEERRASEALEKLKVTIEAITRDLAREQGLHGDATTALARLVSERDNLTAAEAGADERHVEAEAQVEDAAAKRAEQETLLDTAHRETAAIEARRQSLAQEIRTLTERLVRLEQTHAQAESEARAIEADKAHAGALADLTAKVEEALAVFETAQAEFEMVDAERAERTVEEQEARETLRLTESDANSALRAVETETRERVRQTESAANTALRVAETAAAGALRQAETTAAETLRQAGARAGDALRATEIMSADILRRAERASTEALHAAEQVMSERLRTAESKAETLRAEEKALAGLLVASGDSPWPPVMDLITVDKGYETALGAALGDDLDVAIDPAAPVHWAALPLLENLPPLPQGAAALATHVEAPPALTGCLSQIGVVAEAATGHHLQAQLRPGQIIVSRAGDLWRWDGLTAAAEAPTAAAVRLAQHNRLKDLTQERIEADQTLAETKVHAKVILTDVRAQAEQQVADTKAQAEVMVEDARAAAETANENAKTGAKALVDQARTASEAQVAEARARAEQMIEEVCAIADEAVVEIQVQNEARLTAAHDRFETARRAGQMVQERETAARRLVRDARETLTRSRDAEALAVRENTARETRLASLNETLERVLADRADTGAARETAEAALVELPPQADLEAERDRLAREVEMLRGNFAQSRAALDGLKREAEARTRRLSGIADEIAAWERRARAAEAQLELLHDRAESAMIEREALTDRPDDLRDQRETLNLKIEDAEATRKGAADALTTADLALIDARRAARQAETEAGVRRESRVRAEAMVEQAEVRRSALIALIAEELDCKPRAILETMGINPETVPPRAKDLEVRLEKLKRERDQIGPVNLRAETEVEEIEARVGGMAVEREDLDAAITKLRASIGSLNKEGRERLIAAFEQVNQHFSRLFTRLFGGGRAHLMLTQAEDPLNAGLEIYASPPGKKLQVLSLLSGGEQTLTALSLIFAVFMVNPSPVCVLDEVDAPLDDANVVRFCDLCEDVTQETGTRFLVITHHGLTMQRMHRLFGVTMAEPGISQLVSVDLTRASERLAAE